MARQLRFVLPGEAHLVCQPGHNLGPVALDAADKDTWLSILRDAAATHRIVLHAWALSPQAQQLLLTPPSSLALSRFMQSLGRRYVAAFNARHARSGTLWNGRFLSCVVEAGPYLLKALQWVDLGGAAVSGPTGSSLATSNTLGSGGWSSLAQHLGQAQVPGLSDAAAYWALGNTPFERHAAYAALLERGFAATDLRALQLALRRGAPWGSSAFLALLQAQTPRRLLPGRRGRPPAAG